MTTITRSLLTRIALGTMAVALVCALPFASTARADAKTAFAEIKKFDKAGEGGKGVAALAELESDQDPAVTKELAKLAEKAKTDQIAITAMRMCAKRKDEGFLKKIPSLLKDKKKYAKEAPARFVGILKAAELYESPKLSKPLWDVVKKYTSTNSDIAEAAVAAYGTVRDKKIVETMIKHLPVTENNATNLSQETKKSLANTKAAIFRTLATLTGKDIGDTKMWQDFWKEKGKKFEFPDLNAPVVDITTLREHTDSSFNFTVKLPDGKITLTKTEEEVDAWRFVRGRPEIRFEASCVDATNWQVVRLEFMTQNASKGSITNPEKMLDFWEKECRSTLFTEFSKEPEIKELTLNGRKWWQGVARGQPGDGQKGWGTNERRIYCTQAGHMLIYVRGVIRSGAEDSVKAQAYEIMENILVKDD